MAMDQSNVAFVRTEMLPEQAPPASEQGIIKWVRVNLFDGWLNSILTLLALYFIYKILAGFLPWATGGVWNTSSLAECREVLQDTAGGCFSVLTERWNQLLFGFKYPVDQYWRLILAVPLLAVALMPIMFVNHMVQAGRVVAGAMVIIAVLSLIGGAMGLAAIFIITAVAVGYLSMRAQSDAAGARSMMLIFTMLYPFLAFWLIWGGTIFNSIVALAGFGVGYIAFSRMQERGFTIGALSAVVAAIVTWFIGGFISDALAGVLALEPVPSRDLGGYVLNFILGVVCVSLSLPIGIALALGRQSDMPIIKFICVIFIEFVRGVPLITLLFVANVVLAYFLPPGTNFDLILRVIIMITLFSSAYIAEVIRGGLAALPRGQYEAGDSLGLDYAQSMRLVILPQALKISIPGIVNVAVGLFKDTTLVSVISMFDLVGMIRGPIGSSTEWNGVYWELWIFAVFVFFVVCYGISQYSQWLERQLATGHR